MSAGGFRAMAVGVGVWGGFAVRRCGHDEAPGGWDRGFWRGGRVWGGWEWGVEVFPAIRGPGGDRLSRVLRRSIMGAGAFHGRVRNGIGCGHSAEPPGRRMARREAGFRVNDVSGLGRLRSCAPQGRTAVAPDGARPAQLAIGTMAMRERQVKTMLVEDEHGRMGGIKTIGLLVPVSFACCHTSTPGLSTWWSSTALIGSTRFEVRFPLRCLQRLSSPTVATLLRRWRDDRSTRGSSIPVLSY